MYFVDIHTHHIYNRKGVIALYVCSLPEAVWPAAPCNYWAGVHPWQASQAEQSWLDALREQAAASENGLIGIGEIGLDFHRKELPAERQLHFFRAQLEIAIRYSLPVTIHTVRAHEETLALLKTYRNQLKGVVIHGFIGTPQLARRYLDLGCYLSFGANYAASPKSVESLKITPGKQLFLESDQSELFIEELYKTVAEKRGEELEMLKNQLYANYKALFEVFP